MVTSSINKTASSTPSTQNTSTTTSRMTTTINPQTAATTHNTTNPSTNITSTQINLNNTGSQLNGILATYTGDISSCLANCSNQGICVLDSNQQYICQCNQYRTGLSCQSDTRPCSSGPCLNNGICSNINNETSFQCTCQMNLYYGQYCENKIDLCLNNSTKCIKNQGYCVMNSTQAICKCFSDFSGPNCEIESTSYVVRKSFINAATIIAIVVMVCFAIMIFCFDYTKYFALPKMKKKHAKKRFLFA